MICRTILLLFLYGLVLSSCVSNHDEDMELTREETREPSFEESESGIEFPSLNSGNDEFVYRIGRSNTALNNFQTIGHPSVGGRTTGLMIDYTDSTHLICVTAFGGIWQSTNRGESWDVVDDFLPSLIMSDIAQDPFDPQKIYASTSSTIRGANGDYYSSVYVSDDGGQTFNVIPITDSTNKVTRVSRIYCSPTQQGEVYALMDDNIALGPRRIMRSQDGGLTYEEVLNSNDIQGLILDLDITSSGEVRVLERYSVFYSNSGDQGTFVSNGDSLVFGYGYGKIETAPSNDNIIYVAGRRLSNNKLRTIRSINAGQTWDSLANYSSGSFGLVLGVHPTNPDTIFNGGVSLKASFDGGDTFVNYSFNGIDNWDFVFDNDAKSVYQVNDQGIARLSIDPLNIPVQSGLRVDLDSNLVNQCIHRGDFHMTKSSLLLGQQDNGTKWTGHSNATYKGLGGGDGTYCYFHQQDTSIVYRATQYGNIKRINDVYGWPVGIGFQDFDNILGEMDADNNYRPDEGSLFLNPFWVNYANGDQLYYMTKKRVWRSFNKGDNWEPFTSSHEQTINNIMRMDGISSANPDLFYSVMDTLYAIKNAATADSSGIVKFGVPARISDVKASFLNDSTVFLAYTYDSPVKVSKVVDIWGTPQLLDITGDLPNDVIVYTIQASAVNESFIALGTQNGLYVTSNGGVNWEKVADFPNVRVNHMKIRPTDDKLFIFTYGRGPWSADFSYKNSVFELVDEQIDWSVYPNPVLDNWITIQHDLEGEVRIKVYNVEGRLVKKYSGTDKKMRLYVEDQYKGILNVTIENATHQSTRKIVKL